MKTLKVSRASHPATFKKCKNLGQLIAVIEKQGEKENLFVVKIRLNGQRMDSDEENLLDTLSISEIKSLEFDLETMKNIVRGSIADIVASIQDTQMRSISFAKSFRESASVDDEKVKFLLIQCRSIIESLEEIFVAHSKKNFNIKHLPLWYEAEKELTNILQCILQSRKMTDHDFMADLIEYDLVQALDQWEETLEKELLENPAFSGIFNLKSRGSNSDNGVDA